MADREVLIIAGPTASGKSRLALAVAARVGGVIINADAMQLYAALPILSAQPAAAERAQAPHRLYGVLEPTARSSAAWWAARALSEIAAAEGRLPIVVGGAGLYLKALTEGLADLPAVAPEFRARADARRAAVGAAAFHAELAGRDPAWAARIAPGDTQRALRGWEVAEATGRPLSWWLERPRVGPPADLKFRIVTLAPARDRLYRAIDARFRAMIDDGAIAEAARLADLDARAPILKTLGAAELIAHARGSLTAAAACAAAQQRSRNYAKRQSTWFRRQLAPDLILDEQYYCAYDDKTASLETDWVDLAMRHT